MSVQPTSIAVERAYSDDSGVEFGVRFDPPSGCEPSVAITSAGATCSIPVAELPWFIDALSAVKAVALAEKGEDQDGTSERLRVALEDAIPALEAAVEAAQREWDEKYADHAYRPALLHPLNEAKENLAAALAILNEGAAG